MANQFNMDKFNSFLDKATSVISCDSECQKNKSSEELKQKYLDAQLNLITAPNQVTVATKNYITYSQGEVAYNEYNEAKLTEIAKKITTTFKSSFDTQVKDLNITIDTYDGLLINFRNVVDLYTNYIKENAELKKELNETTKDIVTNDRKTYYQDQGISNLNSYYTYILVLYIITVVVYLVSIFVFPTSLSMFKKIIILLFLIIYPFISTRLLSWFISLYMKFVSILPKNVHTDI
jgi:hypothetical protein